MIVDQYRLSGAWNFRDLGGLRADDGRTVKPGFLFRSSELSGVDDEGRRVLTELGVTHVVDLRAEQEVAYNGSDALPAGVVLHSAPVHDGGDQGAAPHEQPKELTKEIVDAALEHAYSRFPTLPGAQSALAYAIRLVADSTGGILIHCAAGKDRAGWITAALLRAAGIADADVLADYLRSNEAIEHLRAIVISRNGDLTHVSDKVLGVHDDFITAAWRVVDTDYGGFDNYLDMIGVDAALLARFRERLLD